MWIATTIVITIVIIAITLIVLSKIGRGRPLITAEITTPDGYNYGVSYQALNPDAEQVEWVWLCTLFPAKMLYNIGVDPDQREEKDRILTSLNQLANNEWKSGYDIQEIVRSAIMPEEGRLEGKTIKATIGYRDITTRSISTELPSSWFQCQFHDSWIALLATSADRLDNFHRGLLRRVIVKLAELYKAADTSSMEALTEIPRQAFLEGRLSRKQES